MKFLISLPEDKPSIPVHWKLVVEWYELGLINGYIVSLGDGLQWPVVDLVKFYGIPPTIVVNSILFAPSRRGRRCPASLMDSIKALGFPENALSVAPDLAEHILKRLQLSDAALDIEDSEFEIPAVPFGSCSDVAIDSTITDTPVAIISESGVIAEPEILELPFEIVPSETELEEPPKSQEPEEPEFSEAIRELMTGELVGEEEIYDEDYSVVRRKSLINPFRMVISSATLLLIVGTVVWLFRPKAADFAVPSSGLEEAVSPARLAEVVADGEAADVVVANTVRMIEESLQAETQKIEALVESANLMLQLESDLLQSEKVKKHSESTAELTQSIEAEKAIEGL